jgi:hypothetical protein
VRQQREEESYFKALFYIKNIKKIEIREKYLLLSLSESPLQFPPMYLLLTQRAYPLALQVLWRYQVLSSGWTYGRGGQQTEGY